MAGDPAAPRPLSPTPEQLSAWGLNPAWSRRVSFVGADQLSVDWHILDTGTGTAGTIVCVHGNPSWGYLWRDLLKTLSPKWRVIAVDQTGMGYSQPGPARRLAQRIDDLVAFVTQEVSGLLVLAAHDWGGPVAIGASATLSPVAMILTNTAVGKPEGLRVPPLISLARTFVGFSCRLTPAFVRGTGWMTASSHRAALSAPYRGASRRAAVRDFVADIPLRARDPSMATLEEVANTLDTYEGPVLLLWGGRDLVFHDRFLRDLRDRLPQAQVQRYADAAHLLPLDVEIGVVVEKWLSGVFSPTPTRTWDDAPYRSVLAALDERQQDDRVIYEGPDGALTWAQLAQRSTTAAQQLHGAGLKKGDRVGLLIPPSPDLLVAAAALWRVGAVPVVADASSGLGPLARLLRAASPRYVIGTKRSVFAARLLRFAPGATFASFRGRHGELTLSAATNSDFPSPQLLASDLAAIVHTSGATGPAKAVRYTHGALAAQRAAVGNLLAMDADAAFTTSFGPFMLLAPLLERRCVRPDFPVDRASDLGFDELAAAVTARGVTTAWLSPASALSVVATAKGRSLSLGLVMLAGAPIAPSLVSAVASITGADVRAPYGMTECLPVTDGSDPTRVGRLGGASTGRTLPGCVLRVEPIAENIEWGEILVAAPWMFDGYDAAWSVDEKSWVEIEGTRFHRTGDVGYLDDAVLFHLGRYAHVIWTDHGPVASVAVEGPLAAALEKRVAAVGLGPRGTQLVSVVIEAPGALRLARSDIRELVRSAAPVRVASILEGRLPLDARHQSKIDRSALSSSAEIFHAGR